MSFEKTCSPSCDLLVLGSGVTKNGVGASRLLSGLWNLGVAISTGRHYSVFVRVLGYLFSCGSVFGFGAGCIRGLIWFCSRSCLVVVVVRSAACRIVEWSVVMPLWE